MSKHVKCPACGAIGKVRGVYWQGELVGVYCKKCLPDNRRHKIRLVNKKGTDKQASGDN